MFCINCGTQIPDDSKFCANCGSSQAQIDSGVGFGIQTDSKTKFVPAKCTGCGASLKVNASEKAAICPYCNNAYIVEQAINNYNINMAGNVNVGSATINVSGVNVDNLLVRAKDFELKYDFENALNYYNQVLDIDFTKLEALNGVERMKNAIVNYIYFQTSSNNILSRGVLQLKKGKLVYLTNSGKKTVYYLDKITKLSKIMISLQFEYGNKNIDFGLPFGANKQWVDIINSAKEGKYPAR